MERQIAVVMLCVVLAALFIAGYVWPPISLGAAIAFVLIGMANAAVPGRDRNFKVGGTD